jgi:hypothetical protein
VGARPAVVVLGILAFAPATAGADVSFGLGAGKSIARGEEGARDLEDKARKLFVLAPVAEVLRLELQFVDLGEFEFEEPWGSPGYTVRGSFSAEGFSAALVPQLTLFQDVEAFLKLGAFRWKASGEAAVYDDSSGQAITGDGGKDDDIDVFGGAGLRLRLTRSFYLRAEYERFKVIDADVDAITGSVEFALRR